MNKDGVAGLEAPKRLGCWGADVLAGLELFVFPNPENILEEGAEVG